MSRPYIRVFQRFSGWCRKAQVGAVREMLLIPSICIAGSARCDGRARASKTAELHVLPCGKIAF